jgi:myosin-1
VFLQVKTHRKHKVLGILDIYGFEAFEQNGFEQLIINFSNEKVQQLVIDWAFRQEQEDIVQQGLEWTQVSNQSNTMCELKGPSG